MNATLEDTRQSVELDTPTGKKLIRKLLRELNKPRHEISIHAWASDDWKIQIIKAVKGELGDPDTTVTIRTDLVVSPNEREIGHHASDSQSDPVTIPRLSHLFLMFSGDVRTFLELHLAGWHFHCSISRGSISSSRHNLGFVSLQARKGYQSVDVGSTTVFVDGKHVIRGAID